MDIALLAAGIVWAIIAVPLLVRVRREYSQEVTHTRTTVWAVWIFYGLLVALVVIAAVSGSCTLGLSSALTFGLGLPHLVVGLAIGIAGIVSMGSLARMNGTEADRLVTRGAFRYSRNPQNVGIALPGVAIALLGDSGLSFALIVAGVIVFRIYLSFEEEHLERTFGDDFADYKNRTPRFIGIPVGHG